MKLATFYAIYILKVKKMKQNPIVLQSEINGEYLMFLDGQMSNENTPQSEYLTFDSIEEARQTAESKGWVMLKAIELYND